MLGAVPVVTYGIDTADADVVAESARFSIWESELLVRTPLGKLQIITPLLGNHNVYNVLAAVATGIALKVILPSTQTLYLKVFICLCLGCLDVALCDIILSVGVSVSTCWWYYD